MQFESLHHVSVNVNDIDQARDFYIQKLGFEPLPRPDLGFEGEWLRIGNQQIHIIAINSGEPLKEQHFAILVDDLDQLINELTNLHIRVSEPLLTPNICRSVFIRDPSGNMIEFHQRLD